MYIPYVYDTVLVRTYDVTLNAHYILTFGLQEKSLSSLHARTYVRIYILDYYQLGMYHTAQRQLDTHTCVASKNNAFVH